MPARKAAIAEGLGGTPKRLAKGEALFEDGDEVDFFFKVVSGCLRTCRFPSDGRRQIDAFHFPGDIVGLEFGPRHRSTAEAVDEASVIAYRREAIDRPPEIERAVHDQAIKGALRSLGRAQNHILLLGRKSIPERVASFLLDMSERIAQGAGKFSLPMERADVADHLGTSVETVSRVLTNFARRHIVEIKNYYSITLADRDALKALVHDGQVPLIAVKRSTTENDGGRVAMA